MENNLYELESQGAGWWDWEVEIIHGIAAHLPEVNGKIQLERTGPYIPTFTMPLGSPLIVTEEGMQKMADANFPNLTFELVDYANIVALDWETWDVTKGLPEDISKEVINFPSVIMDPSKHREDIARKMPKAYAVMSDYNLPILHRPNRVLDTSNYKNEPFINGISGKLIVPLASEEGRRWFEKNGAEWLTFLKFDRPKGPPIIVKSSWEV